MRKKVFKNRIGELAASIILGLLEVLALSLYYRDSLAFWMRSIGTFLLLIALWIACAAIIYAFFCLIQFLTQPKLVMNKQKEQSRPALMERHPFLVSVIVLAALYLPWVILFYPGSAIYDMMYQTVQADGFTAINAHHPIFATYVIGLCSRLGLLITGGLNAGIFLYILLQTAVCILSFSCMISFLAKRGVKRGWLIAVLCFFAVPPLWGGAMQCGTKDTMFTGLFVLFMVLSAKLLLDKGGSFSAWNRISYGGVMLLLCLYRNAILYIMVATLIVFFFLLWKSKKGKRYLILSAALVIVITAAFQTITKQAYHTGTETGEMLSLPFQQTARYVRDHADEMNEKEQQMVETTFGLKDYQELGRLYYPMSSDPVKGRYHWWASDREGEILKTYFGEWFSMLKKHPGTYLEAALSQTYGYYSITPVIKNQKGGAGTTVQFGPDRLAVKNVIDASDGALSEDLIPESPSFLAPAQEVLESWYFLWQKIPVLDLFSKCGFYFLILLALTIYHAKRKNRLIWLSVPSFLLILMAIASPVNEHIRYILPAVAALPLLIGAAGAEAVNHN